MTPDEKHLLLETHELAKENNKLLRKLDRMYRLTRAIRVTYWLILILITLGAYYFIQPFVDSARGVYTSIKGDVENLKAIRENIAKPSNKTE